MYLPEYKTFLASRYWRFRLPIFSQLEQSILGPILRWPNHFPPCLLLTSPSPGRSVPHQSIGLTELSHFDQTPYPPTQSVSTLPLPCRHLRRSPSSHHIPSHTLAAGRFSSKTSTFPPPRQSEALLRSAATPPSHPPLCRPAVSQGRRDLMRRLTSRPPSLASSPPREAPPRRDVEGRLATHPVIGRLRLPLPRMNSRARAPRHSGRFRQPGSSQRPRRLRHTSRRERPVLIDRSPTVVAEQSLCGWEWEMGAEIMPVGRWRARDVGGRILAWCCELLVGESSPHERYPLPK